MTQLDSDRIAANYRRMLEASGMLRRYRVGVASGLFDASVMTTDHMAEVSTRTAAEVVAALLAAGLVVRIDNLLPGQDR